MTGLLLMLIYRNINKMGSTDTINSFKELPEEIRTKLIENFKKLNTKFKLDSDAE
jgi:hypothetical protein